MDHEAADIELALAHHYEGQAELYNKALTIAKELTRALEGRADWTPLAQELGQVLQRTEALASSVAGQAKRWKGQKRRPGPRLASALDRVAGLLRALILQLELAEQAGSKGLEAAVPELDNQLRRKRMREAYSATRASQV